MHPTPEIPKLDFSLVYEPSEDTFCLMDAIEMDFTKIRQNAPLLALEIGSGSGCVSVFLASLFQKQNYFVYVLSIDINFHACKATLETARLNNIQCVSSVWAGDVSSFHPRLNKSIDILLCNPPYVPTDRLDDACIENKPLAASWSGGVEGKDSISFLLQTAKTLLSSKGFFYLLLMQKNGISFVLKEAKKYGLEGEIILKRKAGMELLFVARLRWIK